ncbi:MAG: DNA repair protein [Sphingomonadales bacterium]|nr:DNA repair protein [Sphingomonadales bacterium]
MKVQRSELPAILAGHRAAERFFAPCFNDAPANDELLWVAHVDSGARCLHLERYEGARDSVALPVRSIVADAARLGSAGVLLAHNHPSGDATPSEMDCRATRALACAGEAMDLTVVDHLIFAGSECRSFRRMGLL